MLPYSSEVLFAVFGQFNQMLWPAQIVIYVLALGMLWLVFSLPGHAWTARAMNGLLALAWLVSGVGFYWGHFRPFDFAAPFHALALIIQALLLLVAAIAARPRYCPGGIKGVVGVLLLAYALVGYPLMDWLLGQSLQNLRLFALAPGATLLFTLGLLLLASGRGVYVLAIIPVTWGLVAGVLAWGLDMLQDAILPLASVAWVVLVLMRRPA